MTENVCTTNPLAKRKVPAFRSASDRLARWAMANSLVPDSVDTPSAR